jgi:ABC-2 type transport system ATP-binding protein
VEVPADDAWVPAGAEIVSRDGRGIVLALGDGTTPDAVLDAARAAGTVSLFSLERPTLTDLFREAVAA